MTVATTHTVPCQACGVVRNFVLFQQGGAPVDSAHGMLFDDGWTCDSCIGPEAVGHTANALARYEMGAA